MSEYVTITELDPATGLYSAHHPELLGCRGQGETLAEAKADLDTARAAYLTALYRAGLEAPKPFAFRYDALRGSWGLEDVTAR